MHKPHAKDRLAAHGRLHKKVFSCFSVSIKQRQHWHRWATAFQCKFTQWQLTDIKINIREERRRGKAWRHCTRNCYMLPERAAKKELYRTIEQSWRPLTNRGKCQRKNWNPQPLTFSKGQLHRGGMQRERENKWKCPDHCLVRETAAWQPNSVSRSSQVIPCPSVGLPFVLYTFLCCLNLTSALSTCPIWF